MWILEDIKMCVQDPVLLIPYGTQCRGCWYFWASSPSNFMILRHLRCRLQLCRDHCFKKYPHLPTKVHPKALYTPKSEFLSLKNGGGNTLTTRSARTKHDNIHTQAVTDPGTGGRLAVVAQDTLPSEQCSLQTAPVV